MTKEFTDRHLLLLRGNEMGSCLAVTSTHIYFTPEVGNRLCSCYRNYLQTQSSIFHFEIYRFPSWLIKNCVLFHIKQ